MYKSAVILFLFIIFVEVNGLAGSAGKVNKANSLYDKEEYDKAIDLYKQVLSRKPDSRVFYNMGNALYKDKDYSAAAESYKNGISGTSVKELKQKIYYNLGNAYFSGKQIMDSIKAWREALILNPDDEAARNNLEIALKLIKKGSEKEKTDPASSKPGKKEKDDQKNRNRSEEAKRVLNVIDNMEKKVKQYKKIEAPKVKVEKDW